MDYVNAFESSPQFKKAIENKIGSNSKLTATDIIRRAQTQTCAGCHRLSSEVELGEKVQWPKSLDFTHAKLKDPKSGPDGKRYQISEALEKTFLPRRKEKMMNFLEGS